MTRNRLPVAILATCLATGGAVYASAPSASAASGSLTPHSRCSHKANSPGDGNPDTIEIGDTTRRVGIKKLRGFHKRRENKRVCVFKRKSSRSRLALTATYRPGTRPKMMKRYFKARKKPGFKLLRLAHGSKVRSSKGRRTVLEYTFRKNHKRRHVRIHGDAQVVFKVSSPQRRWKATKRSANKIRRSMKVYNLVAM